MKRTLLYVGCAFLCSFPALALAAQQQVTLSTNSITPATVHVNTGDTVVWNNSTSVTQSVTADDGQFQSGPIASGGQFATTFNQNGTYNYYVEGQLGAILGAVMVSGTSVTTPTTPTYTTTNYVNPNQSYLPSAPTYTTTPTTSYTSTTGSSATALTAQVQSLIAEINSLEGGASSASIAGSPTYVTGVSCPQIGRVLSLGSSGTDVTSLQQFLGVSPASGYYGALTQSAVETWQADNSIISYGTPATTGYGVVGPRTAAAIRLACSGGTSVGTGVGTSAGTSGVVSGYLQVNPLTGAAPLTVTVTATVNAAGACGGAIYNLDFGDGTQDQQIPVAAGNCQPGNQQFTHTYQTGGSYTITLSANGHSTTATVNVSGTSATTNNTTQASGSMTALVTSGNVPFQATFYVECGSGLAYDVVFGDGTDLGSGNVSQTSCTGSLQAVTHTYTTGGSYNAQLDIFTQGSNGNISTSVVATQAITAIAPPTTNSPTSNPPTNVNTNPSTTGGFPPPQLTPEYGGNVLQAQLQFTALACGQPYSINWGDAGAVQSSTNIDCVSGTASGSTGTYSPTHTYAGPGDYTVTLTRTTTAGTTQTDTIDLSVVQ